MTSGGVLRVHTENAIIGYQFNLIAIMLGLVAGMSSLAFP